MKQSLLFLACVLASLAMPAQESYTDDFDYLPFVDAGKSWLVARSTLGQDAIDEVQYYIPLGLEEVNGDGKAYYKMNAFINNTTEAGTYLIREEDRKVYLFDTDTQKEYLMFDYSLKAGDTYETYSYEYHKMVKYKVLSVSDYEEGPEIFSYVYDEETKNIIKHRRFLRKWVVQSDIEKVLCLDPKVWIEGVGSLNGPFANLYDASYYLDHLAYVLYNGEPYLPFTFQEWIWRKLWFGCNMPTGEEYDYSEDKRHQLTYELEGNRLHVYGKVLTHGGANNYAFFIEEPTDDSSVRKLHFKIQEIEPLPDPLPDSDGLALHTTDFYVERFLPSFNYIIIDNQGVEHQVINKTAQMAYRPMIEEDKVWKVGSTLNRDDLVKMVEYYYFDGDTIIDGKTCKQMMRQRYVNPEYPDYSVVMQYPLLSHAGVWYEEDKKVYLYNGKQFMLKYDFSVDANDTIVIRNNYLYVIRPRQTGGIKGFKGVYRDVVMPWYGMQSAIYNTTWLEGVGGIDGPTENVYYGKENHALFLMECAVGDEVIYFNDEYEDGATPEGVNARKRRFDFTHTIKTQPKAPKKRETSDACISSSEREVARPKVKARTRSEAEQSLYGEYNDVQLGINLDPLDDAYQVCITDETGKVVYEKAVNAGNIVGLNIDISAYAKGRYTVTVENSLESFTGEFDAQTTGIEVVRNKKEEASRYIYNLQGQRLSTLQKGLNIVNGRKIYVK